MPTLLDKRVSFYLHQQLWHSRSRAEPVSCCVCLDDFKCAHDHLTTICGHRVHFYCALELKKCPLCRK